jgi:hypothetical protein
MYEDETGKYRLTDEEWFLIIGFLLKCIIIGELLFLIRILVWGVTP